MEDEHDMLAALQKELDKHMKELNASPREEMDNLSPDDMNFILYSTFDEGSPLQFRTPLSNKTLGKIPFLRLFRQFLGIIEENGELKLTAKGNLPRKICLELYETGIIREDHIEKGVVKLSKEADSMVLQNLKIIGLLSGVIKKRNNKLSLTKTGEKLLHAKDRSLLFRTVFETNAWKFNWGFHDGYPQSSPVQMVWGYTAYLLLKYGEVKRDLSFYANKNLKAFPQLLIDFNPQWSTPEQRYRSCYFIRVFERFLSYYGFVETQETMTPNFFDKKIAITATPLFLEVFEIRKENFKFRKPRGRS